MAVGRHIEKFMMFKKTKKMVQFTTCETSFSKHVYALVFGVNLFDLDLWVQVNSVK